MLIKHLKGKSTFQYYENGNMYYKTEDTGLMFPVVVSNETGRFHPTEKSILLMKHIRDFLDLLEL